MRQCKNISQHISSAGALYVCLVCLPHVPALNATVFSIKPALDLNASLSMNTTMTALHVACLPRLPLQFAPRVRALPLLLPLPVPAHRYGCDNGLGLISIFSFFCATFPCAPTPLLALLVLLSDGLVLCVGKRQTHTRNTRSSFWRFR